MLPSRVDRVVPARAQPSTRVRSRSAETCPVAFGERPPAGDHASGAFARVAPDQDPQECLTMLHELEDEDVRSGAYTAFDGASELLSALRPGFWALVDFEL